MKKNILPILTFILFLSITSRLLAGVDIEEIKKKLPKMLGASNAGTEFVFGFHPCWEEYGNNNAIRIYVSSSVATEVRLYIPALSKEPYLVKTTIPNDVIEFMLTTTEAQPYTRGAGGSKASLKPTQVWEGRGIIMESDEPIIVYGITRFQYTSDGFLAIPVHALGKEYTIASYRETADFSSQSLTPYADIIGVYDNTNVTFYFGGNNNSRIHNFNDSIYKPFDVLHATLNRGDFWLIASASAFSDLGGSLVEATKPVSVLSGNHCAYVPTENSACDFIIEQEMPQSLWGYKYYITPIVERKKASIIRYFGKEENTTFYRDGVAMESLFSNWGLENEGWLEKRANPDSNLATTITSDKPINIVQYNTGQSEDGVASDPFQMDVMPESFFANEIVFNTPGIRGGFVFALIYIIIVYKTNNNQIPSDLELGEVISGDSIKWQKVMDIDSTPGSKFNDPDYLGTPISVYSKTIKLPYDAVYHVKCPTQKVGVYSYGFGDYDSYGFPAGSILSEADRKDAIPPKPIIVQGGLINQASDATEVRGLVEDVDDNGNGNLALIIFNKAFSYNTKCTWDKFIPGTTKTVNYTVSMIDSTQDALAVLTFADRAGNDTTITIEFSARTLNKFIEISKPTKDMQVKQETNLDIEWNSNFTENVEVDLYQNKNLIKVISGLEKNDGEMTFAITDDIPVGKNYQIKISSTTEPNIFAFSENFEILIADKKISLIKPNGTGQYEKLSEFQIQWQTNYPYPVDVVLLQNHIVKNILSEGNNDTQLMWKIPAEIPAAEDYSIRVQASDDSTIFAESPLFEILLMDNEKTMSIYSPVKDTKYKRGSTVLAAWDCNFKNNLDIDLYLNDSLVENLAKNLTNNGSYHWKILINSKFANGYYFVISESGNPNVKFQSETFEVYDPSSVDYNSSTVDISVSPNPANQFVKINLFNGEIIESISLFDISGIEVLNLNSINSATAKVEIAKLPIGKYIMKIKTDSQMRVQQLIINR